MNQEELANKEKSKVAGVSVIATVFLTGGKFIVGILTGSLGILSEALHSGLDLVAAAVTYFAVRISDKPADSDHHFGHGKIENLSALIETILLLVTCIWIIYEAVGRLVSGTTHIEISVRSYVVVIGSIIIDYGRSRALSRVAKKYNSQALEADALHFSTDIWSSAVVLLGIICAQFGIFIADSIAALGVAGIVIVVCYQLGKKAIDVLLDTAPADMHPKIKAILKKIPDIAQYHDIRVRGAGADTFVDISIHVEASMSVHDGHIIAHRVEKAIQETIPRCRVLVHIEPDEEEGKQKN